MGLGSRVDSWLEVRPHVMRKASLNGDTPEQESKRLARHLESGAEARQSCSRIVFTRGVEASRHPHSCSVLSVTCERNSGLVCLLSGPADRLGSHS